MEQRTNKQWEDILTNEQYRVLREKGTEYPFTGEYVDHSEEGTYNCVACGNPLFSSQNKFHTQCGWPSFDDILNLDSIKTDFDETHGMRRTEVLCSKCGGHLGHVFPDGPEATTGMRYCINSVALDFKGKDEQS